MATFLKGPLPRVYKRYVEEELRRIERTVRDQMAQDAGDPQQVGLPRLIHESEIDRKAIGEFVVLATDCPPTRRNDSAGATLTAPTFA